mgnify:CR=1 FL=1
MKIAQGVVLFYVDHNRPHPPTLNLGKIVLLDAPPSSKALFIDVC